MSVATEPPVALDLCTSTVHRAVLGVLAVSLGCPAYGDLANDLRNSPPEQFAAIANQSHAQTILQTAFDRAPQLRDCIPRDLLIYFTEMRRANEDRNAQALRQMAQISGILSNADIPVLALKGAADVLCPIHDPAAHRYISDLDLLVPLNRITDAARLLRQAQGLSLHDQDLQPGPHHHLTQIISPDWLFTVELHLRPGSDTVSAALQSEQIFQRAVKTKIPGLLVPCLEDRLLHHVLHGMELRHETAAINLRLLADHHCYLSAVPKKVQDHALARLEMIGKAAWMEDLSTLSFSLSGIQPPVRSWAARALSDFGAPDARGRDTAFWVKRYAQRFWQNPGYRRQVLRKLISPTDWAEFIHFHRDRRSRFK